MSCHRLAENKARLLCGVLFIGLTAALPAQTDGVAKGAANGTAGARARPKVPKEARKALAEAGRLARIPRGTDSRGRIDRLEKATAAFAGIERRFRSVPAVVAEASFRRGQLLGRLARTDDAVAAFDRAAATDPDGFGARAMLEAGHVQRRQKRYPDAATRYRRAIAQRGGRYSDRARLWLGKTLVRLGRIPDARATWRELGADPKADAWVRIQSFDDLAMSYVREKRSGDAKRVLEEAEDALAPEVSGGSKRAKRLRGTLDRMRTRRSLAKRSGSKAKATRK